ncbi:MAG: 3'-5' exonuclease [Holophagaceae bacterium]|nr:3'-5' exonuclease [Holophagaceae bacterium]
MLRPPPPLLWAFDCEWVPDPATGRRVLGLAEDLPDAEVLAAMWAKGGATEADPKPYLKTILCRVVSIAAIIRSVKHGEVTHRLYAVPEHGAALPEDELLRRFLVALGDKRPQLVGFNSRDSDLPILVQRAMVHGLSIPGLGRPAQKFGEGDFFDRYGNQHLDLKDSLASWGKAMPSLHELATACGIPGKLGTDGASVIDLWLAGDIAGIVRYNQFDALTTFLVWLRAMTLTGYISPEQREAEEASVRRMIQAKAATDPGFSVFLEAWERLGRG